MDVTLFGMSLITAVSGDLGPSLPHGLLESDSVIKFSLKSL
jgi:hypothetical protein